MHDQGLACPAHQPSLLQEHQKDQHRQRKLVALPSHLRLQCCRRWRAGGCRWGPGERCWGAADCQQKPWLLSATQPVTHAAIPLEHALSLYPITRKRVAVVQQLDVQCAACLTQAGKAAHRHDDSACVGCQRWTAAVLNGLWKYDKPSREFA